MGDTIGPGGIFRAIREIPKALAIAKDVEKLAPNAWIINYVNPSAVLGIALMRYTNIVFPCIKPAIAALSMLIFLWSWNIYLIPLIILNRSKLFTIPVGIARLGSLYHVDYAAKIEGLAIGTLPLIIVFLFSSKHFIRRFTDGAIKG